jgi:hypothetical protein
MISPTLYISDELDASVTTKFRHRICIVHFLILAALLQRLPVDTTICCLYQHDFATATGPTHPFQSCKLQPRLASRSQEEE